MVKGHENYVPPKEAFDSHYYGIKITTIKPPPPGFPPLERNAGNKCCHNKHQEKRYCHLHNRPMVKVPENNSSHGEVGNCNYLEQYLEKTGQRVPPTTKVIYHDHHLHSPKSSPLPLSPPPPSVSNSSHTCTHDYQRIVKAQKAKADNKTPEDIEAENPLCAEVRRIGDLFFNRVRKEDEKYICESTVALLKGTKQYICLCYQNYLSNHGKSTIARKLESPRERKQRPSFVHYSGRLARMFRKDDGEIRAYSVISISSNKLNNPTHKLCGKNVCQNCSHQH
ncbi:Hypothetical protein CINCED_3A007294 [Cinara cedri]|uniref:Uncharacterized protein n=1 Tax=Cinara cedri TaxID=506608 RepID=A0A5E4MEZ0_9HEMI|nr:Hypothetical protein CINCED_3A007294 [Cinara cedri]